MGANVHNVLCGSEEIGAKYKKQNNYHRVVFASYSCRFAMLLKSTIYIHRPGVAPEGAGGCSPLIGDF